MTWAIKDEWIDLAQAKHVVIYHNPDVLISAQAGAKPVPVEHHLIHDFASPACPHCGHIKERADLIGTDESGGKAKVVEAGTDFNKIKKETLDALNGHHRNLMDYKAKHPQVRLASGPKK